jgi:RHS repeat-associated protein
VIREDAPAWSQLVFGWRTRAVATSTPRAPTTFHYDETGRRASKTRTANTVESTVYVGDLCERRQNAAGEDHVFYVHGEPDVVAQVTYRGPSTITQFVVGDQLDSAALILDDNAAVEKTWFDPFGARVDQDGKPVPDPDPSTTIGFTGHEHDDDNLINMNGRIYDRDQYRFVTPDPFVSNPCSDRPTTDTATSSTTRSVSPTRPDGKPPAPISPGGGRKTTDALKLRSSERGILRRTCAEAPGV